MCIRDRFYPLNYGAGRRSDRASLRKAGAKVGSCAHRVVSCLLYTSDAADERSSVDLGGRRIIKKKNTRDRDGKCIHISRYAYACTQNHVSNNNEYRAVDTSEE